MCTRVELIIFWKSLSNCTFLLRRVFINSCKQHNLGLFTWHYCNLWIKMPHDKSCSSHSSSVVASIFFLKLNSWWFCLDASSCSELFELLVVLLIFPFYCAVNCLSSIDLWRRQNSIVSVPIDWPSKWCKSMILRRACL